MVFDTVTLGSLIIRVTDVDEAVAWYRRVFGLEPVHVGADGEHRIAAYVAGGLVLSLWQLPEGESARPNVDVCPYPVFVTTDIDAVHKRIVAAGVSTTGLLRSANNTFFQLEDLDGNRWEFAQPTSSDFERAAAGVTNVAVSPPGEGPPKPVGGDG